MPEGYGATAQTVRGRNQLIRISAHLEDEFGEYSYEIRIGVSMRRLLVLPKSKHNFFKSLMVLIRQTVLTKSGVVRM